MVNYILVGAGLGFVLILFLAYSGFSALGSKPSESEKTLFRKSKQYNAELEVFQNRRPNLYSEMFQRFTWRDYLIFFDPGIDHIPKKPLPSVKPNMENFLKAGTELGLIWLGHSSLLLNFHGKIILVDPVLSESASPYSFLVRRFQPPPLSLNERPKLT